ncbi:MAG TPA: 2OG-Fe(II) oxygenase [Actinocrinis sp.]|nr:2OG-Fe(II) oxygenase [Actinocrinis sp.]
MTTVPRERMVAVLDRECGTPAFSAAAEAEADLLGLQVTGLGQVRFPITPAQARKLRDLGAPARYGRGTETLTDASVRDTWEVPRDAVTVRWGEGFAPLLDALREQLGLPSSCALRAELHSMLVYERGQFFLPHQDSEKHDAMVGTLVVTLPSRHTGGELVVERGGATMRHHGSASKLALAAFYADCRHEVRPVRTGNRIALTFNLLLDGASAPAADENAVAVGDLARHLREHFTTPITPAYSRAPAVPPDRLVYLLDHEYTERGLDWARLKGADAARAALLRAAAGQTGCRVMLALCEIQETWDAYPTGEDDDWYDDAEDDDDGEAEGDGDGDADRDYELNDLIESATRLVRWTDPDTGRAEEITLDVDETELCAGTANSTLSPYEQQYEGYMGNYGNTLDRWYRRAALVIFPVDREFANRAEASPHWAMTQIGNRARAGDLAGARADAADLAPFWAASIRQSPQPDALVETLGTAHVLDDAATAALLLTPFRVEHLTSAAATALAQLAGQYGAAWTGKLLRGWFGPENPHELSFTPGYGSERLEWYAALPDLCRALRGTSSAEGWTAARTLAELSWRRLHAEADALSAVTAPSLRTQKLAELGAPLAATLAAAQYCGAIALAEQITRQLGELGEDGTVWLLSALRTAAALPEQPPIGAAFESLASDCDRRLRRRLDRPVRAADDWSIVLAAPCPCALCEVLSGFLKDPARRVHEWPLAEQNRRHVHSRIDRYELPVSHETRRQGRPYTLVLTKQDKLFGAERAARAQDQADLAWLAATWPEAAGHR